jgi:RNA polymerase sigma-70 factor (ECF subfamily)
LHLAFFDGLSHSEIADKLQSPLGTIKTRLRRAVLTLRKAAQA